MATIFTFRAQDGQGPLYKQLARYFRQEIAQGHLVSGEFLPLHPSADPEPEAEPDHGGSGLSDPDRPGGVVHNLPNRGVSGGGVCAPGREGYGNDAGTAGRKRPDVLYNFSNNYIDTSTFDTVIWRRCLNAVLRKPSSIAGYGDPQGEPELRQVLARYSYASRGVVCQPEQILVGAGPRPCSWYYCLCCP